jgi:thiol-disulfide isomerase/thioredoxin
MKIWHRLALSSALVLQCASGVCAHAEIFSELPLDQAKQQAQKNNKLLLVDFTASWCPPCRKMESTTWADSAVQAWIKENAIAVQIDVKAPITESNDGYAGIGHGPLSAPAWAVIAPAYGVLKGLGFFEGSKAGTQQTGWELAGTGHGLNASLWTDC